MANFLLLAGLLLVSTGPNATLVNRQISQVALVALVLLAALIVATTYWQTWAAAGLAAREDNEIQRVAAVRDRPRPDLRRRRQDGARRRTSRKKVGGQTLYFRTYPNDGLASQTVGYSTQSRARAGLERRPRTAT